MFFESFQEIQSDRKSIIMQHVRLKEVTFDHVNLIYLRIFFWDKLDKDPDKVGESCMF